MISPPNRIKCNHTATYHPQSKALSMPNFDDNYRPNPINTIPALNSAGTLLSSWVFCQRGKKSLPATSGNTPSEVKALCKHKGGISSQHIHYSRGDKRLGWRMAPAASVQQGDEAQRERRSARHLPFKADLRLTLCPLFISPSHHG